ncbi:IclR family transcriptional regulator [Neobacillus sp. PS3-34]|uniref:IclR family transcriptional regulator n=1 Tax=Neobacillus sp. PS3-34 TaxID=3070678 RepID=UPI0027DF5994|nr:IclR family transcriptional regulator [Neobacillus sp. PS3-34]WML48456.1 IclR family transcriptional regulator [Neobacillus sp. PS3-34]
MKKQFQVLGVSRIDQEKSQNIRVLERVFDIIEAFTLDSSELTLTEISEKTSLSLATIHRFIQTMLARGYIEQDPISNKYKLSKQFVRLGGIVVSCIDLVQTAIPYLQELSNKTSQNCNLSVYDQGKVLCLINIESFKSYFMGIKVGQSLPVYGGALSKVILAHLPSDLISNLISDDLPTFTPQTISHRDLLLKELAKIREQGYAESRGELTIGEAAIAAPIYDYSNAVVAGISISGQSIIILKRNKLNFATSS